MPGNDAVTFDPPRGKHPAHIDGKGRLSLPRGFRDCFANLEEKQLFVTSLDRRIGHIYPIATWRANEQILFSHPDARAARMVVFNANDLGANAVMDSSGRIPLPQELRWALGIEGQPVFLCFFKGRLEVYSEMEFAQRRREYEAISQLALATLERAGLQ